MDLQHRGILCFTKEKSRYPSLKAAVSGVEWNWYFPELAASSDYLAYFYGYASVSPNTWRVWFSVCRDELCV